MPLSSPNPTPSASTASSLFYRGKRSSVPGTILATRFFYSDNSRVGVTSTNASDSTLYLDIDRKVSSDDFMVAVPANGYFEMPFSGALELWGVWDAIGGKALIREFIAS